MTSVTERLKGMVRGTRLEPAARHMLRLVQRRQTPIEQEDPGDRYDRLTVEVMRRILSSDSNCVDAGAADGLLLEQMVDIASEGSHFAFEPLPQKAAILRAKFPGVHCHEMALLDDEGTAPFRYVIESPYHSGFTRRKWDSWDDDGVQMIDVRFARLDDMIPPDLPIRFLKVDVEGSEYPLFKGAIRTLSSYKPFVVFEIGSNQDETWDLLHEAGLSVSLMEDWLEGRPPLDLERYQQEYHWLRNWMFLAHP